MQFPDNHYKEFGKGIRLESLKPKEKKALVYLSQTPIWNLIDKKTGGYVSTLGKKNSINAHQTLIGFQPATESEDNSLDTDNDNIYAWVYTSNIMGFLSHENVNVTIHSRWERVEGEADVKEEVKKIRNYFLYYLLIKAGGFSVSNLQVGSDEISALDLMSLLLPNALRTALSQGIYKSYIEQRYNDLRVKGRIDINTHLKRNVPFVGKVAYTNKEHSYDNAVMQLVRHTIEHVCATQLGRQVMHQDREVRAAIQQVQQATSTYAQKERDSILAYNINHPVSHPYYTHYSALQELCIGILGNSGISYGDKEKKVQGILFDGALLWEEYLATILKEKGFEHYTNENSKFYLFSDEVHPEGFIKIVPDFVQYDENGKIIAIADAKYMHLDYESVYKKNAEEAAPLFYKTVMYMKAFGVNRGYLFFPSDKTDIVPKTFKIMGQDSAELILLGLYIPPTIIKKKQSRNDAFKEFCESIENSKKRFLYNI